MSHSGCHIMHVTCHMSNAYCWSLGHAEQLLFSCVSSKVIVCHAITCHISHITCQMSNAYYSSRSLITRTAYNTNSHITRIFIAPTPWDRPNSNRLMTPPIFDALLLITYTFWRWNEKWKMFICLYSFKIKCPQLWKFSFSAFSGQKISEGGVFWWRGQLF